MTEEILLNYTHQKPTTECYLDGQYFNLVLESYEGLINRPIVLVITTHSKVKNGNEWEEPFDITVPELDDEPIQLQFNPKAKVQKDLIQLARVILEIEDESHEIISRHSNLLIFDLLEQKVLKFEPLKVNKYSLLVNQFFIDYFHQYLPGFTFSEINLHPQRLINEKGNPSAVTVNSSFVCYGKGMCVAYVTKLAAMIAAGENVKFPSDPQAADLDIRKFVTEIEQYFGPLETDMEDIEYALSQNQRTAAGAGIGAVAGLIIFHSNPVLGLVAGGLAGGLIGHYTYKNK